MDTTEAPPPTLPANVPEPDYGNRRTSKIGRLPKPIRDQINLMLLDGLPHPEIVNRIPTPNNINVDNIDRWAKHSYPLWLAEFNRLQETRVKQEVAMDLACPDGGSRIHEATLQLTATTIAEMVRRLDLSDFEELLHTEPAKIIPFLNALAAISNAELKCERHRLEVQERRTKLQAESTVAEKSPGLKPETRQTLERDLNLM